MNQLTDLADEVARLNAERNRRGDAPEQPATPPTSDDTGAPAPTSALPAVQEAGPPRLIGISFEGGFVGSSLGNFELLEEEIRAIARISLRAVERAMKKTYADIISQHALTKPRKLRVVKRARRGSS